MKCPVDGSELVMSERQKVEIDYCPQCRGVWLDRGELDKIVDRLEAEGVTPERHSQPAPQPYQENYQQPRYDSHGSRDHDGYGKPGYRKKRRESWFGELFD